MEDNNKVYGFTISIYEFEKTISSLWGHVKDFIKKNPQNLARRQPHGLHFRQQGRNVQFVPLLVQLRGGLVEILAFAAYRDFFDYLTKLEAFSTRDGATLQSFDAAALFLSRIRSTTSKTLATTNGVYTQCPLNSQFRYDHKCHCDPNLTSPSEATQCGNRYYDVMKKEKPKEWVNYT